MTNDEARVLLTAQDVVALTMFGEARGDGRDGSSVEERIAVGCVIRNRLRTPARFGTSYQLVCLKRWQFSCWLEADPNSETLWNHARAIASGINILDSILKETHFLALGIVGDEILDRTGGATHYYAPRSMVPVNSMPDWAVGKAPIARIGTQLFFKGV